MRRLLVVIVLLVGFLPAVAEAAAGFDRWKTQFAIKLRRQGFSEATVVYFLDAAEYRDTPVRAQQRQPEKTILFDAYRRNLITPQRIADGRQALREQGARIEAVAANYGIEREVLAALWGIESSYGRGMGKQPVIASLATLAYAGRRKEFFEKELIAALRVAEAGQLLAERMVGSWAGAMGHYQFIPTTCRRFGMDGDGDGRIDLCGSYPDALASAGNYLHGLDWRLGDARIVTVDAKRGRQLLAREGTQARFRPVSYWKQAGLLAENGSDNTPLLKLVGADNGRSGCFLVGAGFDKLKEWNRSTYFALTVLLLAEQLANGSEPPAAPAAR
jgi:membrane-bound lytic murein transglycosylase B